MSTLALVFDFDDTLVPDSTSGLLREYGVNTDDFWLNQVKALIKSGYEPTHAYLKRLVDLVGDDKPLGPLTNRDLRAFGRTLNDKFFPGLPQMFDELRKDVSHYRDIGIEFYIISGGLQEIIEGTRVLDEWGFSAVYASQLAGDTEDGVLRYVKRAITFTEKTRYLFEINKGITPGDVLDSPYLVNKELNYGKRRIPFANIIYVGDGLTDVPCFSLVKKGVGEPDGGGITFAVFDPAKAMSAKQALQDYLKPGRVFSVHAPHYTLDRELGALIRAAVSTRCSRIKLEEEEPK